VTRVREWCGGVRATGLMVQFVSEKKLIDGNQSGLLRNTGSWPIAKDFYDESRDVL